jgi:hypothetical protein
MNSASGSVSEVQDLEEVWLRAVDIARNKLQNRYVEVVREVAHRRHAVAADLLKDALQVEEAVEVAMAGNAWDKARDVASGNSKLAEQVIRAYDTHHHRVQRVTSHLMTWHIIVVYTAYALVDINLYTYITCVSRCSLLCTTACLTLTTLCIYYVMLLSTGATCI